MSKTITSSSEKRGSQAPANKTLGNIHTLTLKEYLPSRYNSLRLRIKFLGWEVDVELLEISAGASVWIVFSDVINLMQTKAQNHIYDLMFTLLPPLSWAIISGVIGFIHLLAILSDRSSEPNYQPKEDSNAIYLRIRYTFMAFAFLFDFTVVSSIFVCHTYALAWKLMALFTIFAFFSHIRLRECYTRLMKKQRKQEIVLNTS